MGADPYAWVPSRAREAARKVGLGGSPDAMHRRRGIVLGSVWIGEGRWCYVDSGSPETPTVEEIEGFDDRIHSTILLVMSFPEAIKAPRSPGTVYLGRAVVDSRYVSLVEELWPEAVWSSRGEREPVGAFVGSRPVALIAPIADKGGDVEIRDLTRPDVHEQQASRIVELERDVRRGEALRKEIERLAERGEGYASARELRRALAMEEPTKPRNLVSFAGSPPQAKKKHEDRACVSLVGEPAPLFVGAEGCPGCKRDVALALEGSE